MKKIFILLAFISTFNLDTLQINGASSSDTQVDNQDLNRQLFQAVINNNLYKVQELINTGADVNALNGSGLTPLYEAVERGNTNIARALIAATGIKVNTRGRSNFTPLHLAAYSGNTDIAQALIATTEVNVNARSTGGDTPLHRAVTKHHVDIVKALIDRGANVNAQSTGGYTPLHWAVIHGPNYNTNIIQALLINAGADINIWNVRGVAPIDLARSEIKQLLQNIVNVEQQLENLSSGGSIEPILDQYNENFRSIIIHRLIFKGKFNLVTQAEKAYPELKVNELLKQITESNPDVCEKYKEFLAQEEMLKELWENQQQGVFADVMIVSKEQEKEKSTDTDT